MVGARVVVVEDENAVREAVVRALEGDGLTVISFTEGDEVGPILSAAPDLALLDIALPRGDGLGLAKRLRARRDLPIVFLTARDGIADRLAGFALGADDYLVKPFALEELLARVRAVLRRSGRLGEPIEAGDVLVDEQAGFATRARGTRADANRDAAAGLLCAPSRPGPLQGAAPDAGVGV